MFRPIVIACTLAVIESTALPHDPIPRNAPLPTPTEPTREPTNVAELFNAYRYYELPLPPNGSYLVKRERKVTHVYQPGNKTEVVNEFRLALIRNEKDKQEYKDYQKVEPSQKVLLKNDNGTVPDNMSVNHWIFTSEWLIFASQAHHLGWKDVAQYGWDEGSKSNDLDESKTPILNSLKRSAWEYLRNEMLDPKSDRKAYYHRMKRTLCLDDQEFHKEQKDFLNDLAHTIRRDWNRTGTPDDVIDGIVRGDKSRDDLLRLGFEAVPALIRHLNDDRLTRETCFSGFMNSWGTYQIRVSDICCSLLQHISNGENSRFEVFNGEITNAELHQNMAWEANEWFREANLYGEKRWCLKHVLTHIDGAQGAYVELNETLLFIVREKYPDELPAFISKYHVPIADGFQFLNVIASSRLPHAIKLAALLDAEKNPDAWHPLEVMRAWKSIDGELAKKKFAACLDRAVRMGKLDQIHRDKGDTTVLDCLHEFHDPAFWKQFETLLPRFEIQSRSRMIECGFRRTHTNGSEHKEFRMTCLLRMIDDPALSPNRNSFISNGVAMNPQYMGQVATVSLGRELGINVPKNPDRTAAEWSKIRDTVRSVAEKAIGERK